MSAVDHLLEYYKSTLRGHIARRGSIALNHNFYSDAKSFMGMSKRNVDKAINELVDAGEIVLEGTYLFLTAKWTKRSEEAE
ncbi:MAG: hypothetical protein ACP59X_11060 [Solidesulfovibrio sp. DCME]|uniref:hypothetical protein n=1 Tax=Solidesulfovibrio sp. DCME TaxID=3447380 RepID=UPI003D0ADD85